MIRDSIINHFFQPTLFAPESFGVVCCFQTFDHLADPDRFVKDVRSLLRPGGLLLALLSSSAPSHTPSAIVSLPTRCFRCCICSSQLADACAGILENC